MRKLFFLFLVLIATINLYAYDFQFGDLYYNITSDDEVYTVEVTYQEESAYNYIMLDSAIIPETVIYNDITYSVTGIGKAAFKDCFSLVEVTLPKSIVSIHEEAFYKCTSLSSITMENGIFLLSLAVAKEMPVIVNLGVLLDLFIAVFILGMLVREIDHEFHDLEVSHLSDLKDYEYND